MWRIERNFCHAIQHRAHIAYPDGQRHRATGFISAQGARLVKAHPRDAHQLGVVAPKPCVEKIVGGAGLAGQVVASEFHGGGGGAIAHHIAHHLRHQIGVAFVDRALRAVARARGLGLEQEVALAVLDALYEVRLDPEAAIGKHRVRAHHLHGRGVARAQRHGEIGWVQLGIETKTCDVVLCVAGADGLQYADGHQVFRAHQCLAHGDRTVVGTIVILGIPCLATGLCGAESQGLVVEDGAGPKAFFQSG